MKTRLLLAATALCALAAAPASAATLTGSYTVTLGSTTDGVLDPPNLPLSFSIPGLPATTAFISVNPQACYTCLYQTEGYADDLSVTFSNLTVGSTNFGGFTEKGEYSAHYTALDDGTDAIVWDGEVGGMFTKTLTVGGNVLTVQLIDGSDWNVTSNIAVSEAVAATPIPAAVWMFGSALSLGALVMRRRKKTEISVLA
jgi:hypothetical protein